MVGLIDVRELARALGYSCRNHEPTVTKYHFCLISTCLKLIIHLEVLVRPLIRTDRKCLSVTKVNGL